MLTTLLLKGVDAHDLDTKERDLRSDPTIVVAKVHPDEPLLEMQSLRFGDKLLASNTVSRRIEYEI